MKEGVCPWLPARGHGNHDRCPGLSRNGYAVFIAVVFMENLNGIPQEDGRVETSLDGGYSKRFIWRQTSVQGPEDKVHAMDNDTSVEHAARGNRIHVDGVAIARKERKSFLVMVCENSSHGRSLGLLMCLGAG